MFINFVVIVSIITLGMEDPLENPNARFVHQLSVINYIITTIFILELIMKIIIYGLVLGHDSYMRSGWNLLDFTIVAISITSYILEVTLDQGSRAG